MTPQSLDFLEDVPLTIITNSREPNDKPEASVVSALLDALSASGRATVVGVPKGESGDEAINTVMEKERLEKERIEKAGVPKGKHWWQLRGR